MTEKESEGRGSRRWLGCDIEEAFLGEDRKAGRVDRKRAVAKDRSKYKKTDQDKQQRKREAAESKVLQEENLKRGRVLSITSKGIEVEEDHRRWFCSLRGALKKEKTHAKNLVIVGDYVLFEPLEESEGSIAHVEQRKTVLSRADNLSRRKEQLLAANIDQVLITVSVVIPPLKPSLVDRYLIATLKGGMEPVIVVNKVDLLNSDEAEGEWKLFEDFVAGYRNAGLLVVPVSTVTGQGIEDLRAAMKDRSSVFSGASGVGKSSLINAVTGLDLLVGDPVQRTRKGAHTTSTAQLIPLVCGGWCIDTPGIKSFGVWDLDEDEIEQYFSEIHECGLQCRYPDCSHIHEEDCAVKLAVEEGRISPLRYDSYISLKESVREQHRRR